MTLFETIKNNHFWNKYGLIASWVIGLIMLSASLTYIAWNGHKLREQRLNGYVPNAPIITKSKNLTPKFNAVDITSAKLFGDPSPKKAIKRVAPKTTLNLKLLGILSASNPDIARAIIASGNGKAQLYSIGENIKGANASIDSINANEVLLNRGGAVERLPIIKKVTSRNRKVVEFLTPQTTNSKNNATPVSFAQQVKAQQINSTTTARVANSQPRVIKKPILSDLDQALKKLEN